MPFESIIDDVSADNLDNVGWFPNTDNNTLTGSSYYVNNIWEQLYYRVQLANNLINLEEAKGSQSDEDQQIEAQARAMRAWFYERLCMFYGDVPLLTTNGTTTTRDLVKYPGPNGTDPYPIVRIAEMYLIAAEAEGREKGLKWLNALRASRGLKALTAADIADDDAYEARIMQERRVEFVGEGLRWYDLRRWFNRNAAGKKAVLQLRCYQTGETTGSRRTASDAMNISEDGHELLWPVPTVARDNNSALSQNPGY